MKRIFRVLTLGFAGTILLMACSKSDSPEKDTEAPTIEFTKPLLDGTTNYSKGVEMGLNATFKDNKELSKCVVTIEYLDQSIESVSLKGFGSPWAPAENEESYEIDLSGETEITVTENLFDEAIEMNCLGGAYQLKFVVTDKEGNELTTTVDVTIQ
nr:DUF4625 domain-containing protein [uncultured Carboxylicivirga sp.]